MITKIDIKLHVNGQHYYPRLINIQRLINIAILVVFNHIVSNIYYN